MTTDLFGNAVIDPMRAQQLALFGQPPELPATGFCSEQQPAPSWKLWKPRPATAADARIARQYLAEQTPALLEDAG